MTSNDIAQTNSNIVGRRTLCKPGSRNAVGEMIFILLSSESEPLETLFCGALRDYLRILGAKKIRVFTVIVINKVRTYVFAELARNSNIPKMNTRQGQCVYASRKFSELERSVNFESDSRNKTFSFR